LTTGLGTLRQEKLDKKELEDGLGEEITPTYQAA
jgi:hypothetical protein